VRAALAAVAATLLVATPAQARTVVDAGALRANVVSPSGQLEFTNASGRRVLKQASNSLGFRTAAGWQHATVTLSSVTYKHAYQSELATTDPERRIELRVSRRGDGVITLIASISGPPPAPEAMGIGFAARPGEHYLGFGERSNAVDQAGSTVENYVSDGPYQAEEYPLINLFTPPWGLRDGHQDATYYPVPWLLSSAGYGVLVENSETSYFRLGSDQPGAWSVEVTPIPEGGETGAPAVGSIDHVQLDFFAGPKPADALRRFTAMTGRQPKPASPWLLGPWYQADDDAASEIAALHQADAPFSALQTYTHYLPCGAQVGQEQAERERVAQAHDAGLAITTYFNPMICTSYQPAYQRAAEAGALTADASGSPYLYHYGADVDQAFLVAQFDFSTDAGREQYAHLLDEAITAGYDGWMEDFGEYTPLDSLSGGVPGTRAHNPYPTEYHCAAFDAVEAQPRPVIRFQRSGWTGAARCAQVVWGGDPTTSFGFDGLRSAVTQALTAGASGIGIWGSDIGGFFALGENALTPELLTRWVQLGAVSPVMRTEANGVAVPSKPRPQVLDPDQIDNWRRYAKLHTQLYPYLSAAVDAYRRTGLPVMRSLALVNPEDPRAAATTDEFFVGGDLLAAPVLDAGATTRSLYLPKGKWVDLWRSAAYRPGPGEIGLRKARVLRGKRSVTVPAPLDQLPLMVRIGAVIPMLPANVDTLAPYGKGIGDVDSLADNRSRLRLLAFPRDFSVTHFPKGGVLASLGKRTAWTMSIFSKVRRRYSLEASLVTLKHPFVPCAIAVDGEPLERGDWSFDRSTGVLDASFALGKGQRTVHVRPCL
jgi:alpha-glucosidase (family GH31 glycosyl hydrolase)